MNLRPIIIVPYRDRPRQLAQFIDHMQRHYGNIPICIIEQDEDNNFNRGKLLNIGFLENPGYTHYIFHDVDMLPINVSYLQYYTKPVLQLARSNIQLVNYLGGVTRFSNTAFSKSGGYHNDYYHRAEDNEMRFNLKRLDMAVINKPGAFKILQHERQGPEFDPALWAKAQKIRVVQNQLAACQYEVMHTKKINNVRHMLVKV